MNSAGKAPRRPMSEPASLHRRAILGLLGANFLWGLSFPLIKAAVHAHEALVPGSGNWFITAMTVGPRFLLAAVVLGLLLRTQLAALTRAELHQGVRMGLSNGLGMLL